MRLGEYESFHKGGSRGIKFNKKEIGLPSLQVQRFFQARTQEGKIIKLEIELIYLTFRK